MLTPGFLELLLVTVLDFKIFFTILDIKIVFAVCQECFLEYVGDCPEHGGLNIVLDAVVRNIILLNAYLNQCSI